METEDQKKVRERNDRYIVSNGLISCMSNAKWKAFFGDLITRKIPGPVASLKEVRSPTIYGPSRKNWNEIVGYKYIEWIKIHPREEIARGRLAKSMRVDSTDLYISWLESIHVPFEYGGDVITIFGYRRLSSLDGVLSGARRQ